VPDQLAIEPRDRLGIASVMARRNVEAAAIGARIGLPMPNGARAAFSGSRTVVGTGAGTWLLFEEEAASDFADILQEQLAGLASVSDQSSAYSVQRISGAASRRLLQRGAAIDLHPESFGPGAAAVTVFAHIGVILWQVDQQPTYEIATFRSYTESFRHWLEQSLVAL
jgi:sarcosine oxidase subunit gamma